MDEPWAKDDRQSQADVIAFLEEQRSPGKEEPPERIDTHCAIVFLAGDTAWKLKKAVRFGYLDFSTADKRREALEAELRLNRRTAPALYRAVHAISRGPDGGLRIGGEGRPVDWLLEMRRFPADALLDRQRLSPALLMRLADRIADFHASCAPVTGDDGAARLSDVIDGNAASMAACDRALPPDQVRLVLDQQRRSLAEARPCIEARERAGRVRHGHGDLHLANIAVIDREPTLFDCLEFDDALATTDILYDLAFLLMDLWHRGCVDEANMVLNRYIDVSPADEDGLALLPLFLSIRATIRAHVLAQRSLQAGGDIALATQARTYLDLALFLLVPVPPRLIAIGGLSGTGKSSVARLVGGHLGRPPGARILRSDVIRKRLAGLPPETRLPAWSYSEESGRRVYATVIALAQAALAQKQAVIVDAVFAGPEWPSALVPMAKQADVPFSGFWLSVGDDIRIRRVRDRAADASDADMDVALAQAGASTGAPAGWAVVDAAMPIGDCASALLRRLDR
ncbi:bifunctional aminoglycoside phosphotransferase/ATP-binding protein [Sphingomonas oryzagri]